MTVERIEKDGVVYAMMPYIEFEKIAQDAEMLADVQAFQRAKADGSEAFPIEFGEKLSDAYHTGKSLIPLWREYRNMTQSELAEKSSITQPYLSAIESGAKNGSIDAMKKIANALDVIIDDLV